MRDVNFFGRILALRRSISTSATITTTVRERWA
jgi:hypothetical protein